ncbi:MAG: hypothetical protein ACI4C1_10665 [Lachnospiraceae bacterium]
MRNTVTVCTGRIHVEGITMEQIQDLLDFVKVMIEKLVEMLQ